MFYGPNFFVSAVNTGTSTEGCFFGFSRVNNVATQVLQTICFPGVVRPVIQSSSHHQPTMKRSTHNKYESQMLNQETLHSMRVLFSTSWKNTFQSLKTVFMSGFNQKESGQLQYISIKSTRPDNQEHSVTKNMHPGITLVKIHASGIVHSMRVSGNSQEGAPCLPRKESGRVVKGTLSNFHNFLRNRKPRLNNQNIFSRILKPRLSNENNFLQDLKRRLDKGGRLLRALKAVKTAVRIVIIFCRRFKRVWN